MHRKGTAPPIHMYGLTLQKTNRINQAVHGNFAGTKQQLIVVGRGKILELLKPDSSTGTMSSLCGLFQLPVSLKKKAEGKFLCALSLCVCVHACAVCTNVRVCTIVRVCVCVCVSLSPSLSLSPFLSFFLCAGTNTNACSLPRFPVASQHYHDSERGVRNHPVHPAFPPHRQQQGLHCRWHRLWKVRNSSA